MTRGKAFGWFMLGYVTANLLAAGIDLLADWYEKKEAEQATQEKVLLNGSYGKNVVHMDVVSAYPSVPYQRVPHDLTEVIRQNIKRDTEASYPTDEDLNPLADQDAAWEAARDNAERNMD